MSLPIPQSPVAQPLAQTGDDPERMAIGVPGQTRDIAFLRRAAAEGVSAPGLVWLPGFMSDMGSTKAAALDEWARVHGRALLRLDYSGHGLSGGRFEDGNISRWLEEVLAVLRSSSSGPQILVGSSMGGYLALLAARALAAAGEAERLHAMVLIAPAVDFTQALMWPRFSAEIRHEIETEGVWMLPSAYGKPYPVMRGLIEDGRQHLLLGQPLRSHCPVHILQGMSDPDVPWTHAMQLVEHLASDPVVITLIKDGDHRLSRPEDIARLLEAIAAMS